MPRFKLFCFSFTYGLLALTLTACDNGGSPQQQLDCDWFRQTLLADNLDKWRQASPTADGYFLQGFARDWTPLNRAQDTLVSQSRMIYAMATGYELTGGDEYLQTLDKGLAFLLNKQRNTDTGSWYRRVDMQGNATVKRVHHYGNGFVIFGLSHAARVTRNPQLSELARQTWDAEIDALAAHPGAAPYFPHRVTLADQQASEEKSAAAVRVGDQNSLLHLFEAGLELYLVLPSQQLLSDIRGIADFVIEVASIDGGRIIPSWHDQHWKPSFKNGGEVNPGHQLEWAHFLNRATQLGLSPQYVTVAERMLEFPLAYGFDDDGGMVSALNFEGKITSHSRGYWEQAETLSALMHFAHWNWREDLWPLYERQLQFVQRWMIDPDYGGWFADSRGGGSSAVMSKEKIRVWQQKRDIYHITNAFREGLMICGELERHGPPQL